MPDGSDGRVWTPRKGVVAGGPSHTDMQSMMDFITQGRHFNGSMALPGGSAYQSDEKGGWLLHGQFQLAATGGGDATLVALDTGWPVSDWRRRRLVAFVQSYDSLQDLPGGSSDATGGPDYPSGSQGLEMAMLYTKDGSTQSGSTPPNNPRRAFMASDLYLFVDSGDSYKLKMANVSTGNAHFFEMLLWASSQLWTP